MDDDQGAAPKASRLLRRLHRAYRPGQDAYGLEDLFTEYLAWLLNRSHRFRVAFANLALDKSAEVSPEVFTDAVADTQVSTGWGRIDLVLDVPNDGETGDRELEPAARLAIECKVDSRLEGEQLVAYHSWLEEQDRCENVALAALTRQRLGRRSPFGADEPPYWQGRFFWHEVEAALGDCIPKVRAERLPAIDPEDDEFLGPAGFVVIGDELRDLMREEGMLAATMIEPGELETLHSQYERYRRRVDEILSLVENALDRAEVEKLLREEGGAETLHTKHKKNRSKGRPVSVIYHRDDPPAAFMFGVMVSPPNRYARRPGEPRDPEAYEAELIAGYKLLDKQEGALQMNGDLERTAESLTATLRELPGPDAKVFVPENAGYQKWIARTPVPVAEDADEQEIEMAEFYRSFVSAFVESDGPDDRTLLERIADRHREAVGTA